MKPPSWINKAIFYQIFPDRFFDGDKSNDPANVCSWRSKPTFYSYHGGDLEGIIQKFDYLKDLGVNAIYLNPIFLSTTPHGYNTSDYFRIEPRIGDESKFLELIKLAHKEDMKVILDGVFNHTGRGFFAFLDILENGQKSPYVDWYCIKGFPLDAFQSGEAKSYEAWFAIKSLPKLNTDNPAVFNYIMHVLEYWLERGVDGWRLDVPNEIDDDNFWSLFRAKVREINPEAYLVGEIWHAIPRWVQHFDGLMNYPFRDVLLGLLNEKVEFEDFVNTLSHVTLIYPEENIHAMYNLLGSHDTIRLFSMLNGNIEKIKLATLIQFFFPGVPAIYYGDEIGMQGGKDPECRAGFIWDETEWKTEIRNWIKTLIQFRKTSIIVQEGDFGIFPLNDDNKICLFERSLQNDKIYLIANFSSEKHVGKINKLQIRAKEIEGIIHRDEFQIDENNINIPLNPYEGVIFKITRKLED